MIQEKLLADLQEAWPLICPDVPEGKIRLFKLTPGAAVAGVAMHDYPTLSEAAAEMRYRQLHDPVPADMGLCFTVLAPQGLHQIPGTLGYWPGDENIMQVVFLVKAVGRGWLNAHALLDGKGGIERPRWSQNGSPIHKIGQQAMNSIRAIMRA